MATEPTPRPLYATGVAAVAAGGGFLFGYDSGVINGTVGALREAFGTSTAGTGFAVASVLVGCAAGAFVAGTLADRYGRRPMMLVTAVLFLVSAARVGAADTELAFNAWRIVGGLAVGGASVLAPAYIAEVAPPAVRGRLGSLQQLAIVLGLFGSFLANYLIAAAAGGAGERFWLGYPAWRWMFWAEAVPAAGFLVGVLFLPESPRFLVARGRDAEAERVFTRAVGGDAAALVREVRASLAGERPGRLSDLREPGTGRVRRVVWVGLGLSAFQQLVGINVIFYYGEVLWRAAGLSEGGALLTNVVTGVTNVLATLVAIALIDRVGRRPLLLAGSAGMAVGLGVMAAAFSTGQAGEGGRVELGRAAAVVALAAATLSVVAVGVSWGPVVWVLLGEMFPNACRGVALAVAAAGQWVANFLVTVSFPGLLAGAGLAGAYVAYGAAAAVSLAFVWRLVPETVGRRLEEM